MNHAKEVALHRFCAADNRREYLKEYRRRLWLKSDDRESIVAEEYWEWDVIFTTARLLFDAFEPGEDFAFEWNDFLNRSTQ